MELSKEQFWEVLKEPVFTEYTCGTCKYDDEPAEYIQCQKCNAAAQTIQHAPAIHVRGGWRWNGQK